MITIIFLDEDKQPVTLSFIKNEAIISPVTGTWNMQTNVIELGIEGWNFFQSNRNNIRKLKPMLDQLDKLPMKLNEDK